MMVTLSAVWTIDLTLLHLML